MSETEVDEMMKTMDVDRIIFISYIWILQKMINGENKGA